MPCLFDLGFAKFYVLARHRIIFLHDQLVGLGPGVLLGDIEEAGIGRADELDFDGCGLGHGSASNDWNCWRHPKMDARKVKLERQIASPSASEAKTDIVINTYTTLVLWSAVA